MEGKNSYIDATTVREHQKHLMDFANELTDALIDEHASGRINIIEIVGILECLKSNFLYESYIKAKEKADKSFNEAVDELVELLKKI